MRILHLVHQYPPDFIAGTELYTQTMAHYQLAAGHSVAVFVPAPQGSTEPIIEDGIRVYRESVGQRSGTQVFVHTFYHRGLAQALMAVLAQEAPDVIHVQHLMGLPFGVMTAVIQARIPYVITLHDYWYGCANGQLITNTNGAICAGPDRLYLNCGRCAIARAGFAHLGWLAPCTAPLMAYRNGRLRHILTHAAKVIAPTHFVHQTYRQMGLPDANFVVIPHGIEIPHEKIAWILSQREAQARPSGHLHIGYIGSIAPQKGIHILIDAVNQLPIEGITLTLYGGLDTFPDYVAQLRQAARHPGILFAGHIAREDVWAALAAFDVVVMPTLWYESSPLVIDEVLAVRTPVIASAIGSMPEKIRDGKDGLLFPPGDVPALHQILRQLHQNRERLRQLRQNIRPVRTMIEYVQDIDGLYTAFTHAPEPTPGNHPTTL